MYRKDLTITLLILLPLTLIFWFTNLDIQAQSWFYHPAKCWCMAQMPFWDFIYRYGIFAGYLWVLIALVGLIMSYWFPQKYLNWRKPAFLMVFTMIVGPGLLVNVTLKDHWGRARPRDIQAFDGKEVYTAPWVLGNAEDGKSFPCGHCSMGFFLAVPFLFFRHNRKVLAYGCLGLGLFFGFLLGVARMMAGGHFLSDVIWSGGIVWLTAIGGYYGFKIYKPLIYKPVEAQKQKRNARRMTILIGIVVPFLTVALLLATPYISEKNFEKTATELSKLSAKTIHFQLDEGTIELKSGENLKMHYQVNAFGFPNSKMGIEWTEKDTCVLTIVKTGWFTEVRNNIQISIPQGVEKQYLLTVEKGKVFLEIPANTPLHLKINIQKGDLILKTTSQSDFQLAYSHDEEQGRGTLISNQSKVKLKALRNRLFTSTNAPCRLDVHIQSGKIFIE
jgi:lipid A 4'-phosphatase